jgi:hypothetical protein
LAPFERFAVEPPLVRPGQACQKRKEIAKHGSWIATSHRSTSVSVILRQFWGHFRGVPLVGAAHIAAISPESRRVVMEGFFTKRICFASLWITLFCRAAESPSDTEFLDGPPLKKSKNGEILALFSVGDFPIDANRSVAEGPARAPS